MFIRFSVILCCCLDGAGKLRPVITAGSLVVLRKCQCTLAQIHRGEQTGLGIVGIEGSRVVHRLSEQTIRGQFPSGGIVFGIYHMLVGNQLRLEPNGSIRGPSAFKCEHIILAVQSIAIVTLDREAIH